MEMLCKYIVAMRCEANSSFAFWKFLKKIFCSILTHRCRTRGHGVSWVEEAEADSGNPWLDKEQEHGRDHRARQLGSAQQEDSQLPVHTAWHPGRQQVPTRTRVPNKTTVVAETSGENWQLLKHPAELCPNRSEVLVTQSCPTLCTPMDCGPPGSSVHGVLQARILEGVTMPSSRGSSWPRDGTVSLAAPALAGDFFIIVPPGKPKYYKNKLQRIPEKKKCDKSNKYKWLLNL